MLGKICKRAAAHSIPREELSNPASKSWSVVSSVGRTAMPPSMVRPRIGNADARAKDDADMDNFRRAGKGEPWARSLGRPPTHPLPAVLFLLEGLAIRRRAHLHRQFIAND